MIINIILIFQTHYIEKSEQYRFSLNKYFLKYCFSKYVIEYIIDDSIGFHYKLYCLFVKKLFSKQLL